MTTWVHARKGKMVGEIVRESADGTWVDVKLTGDQRLRVAKGGWDECHDGEVVTVRKSFLREVGA